LDQIGIISAGRFGEWDYLWSNQAFMSGMKAAKRISHDDRTPDWK